MRPRNDGVNSIEPHLITRWGQGPVTVLHINITSWWGTVFHAHRPTFNFTWSIPILFSVIEDGQQKDFERLCWMTYGPKSSHSPSYLQVSALHCLLFSNSKRLEVVVLVSEFTSVHLGVSNQLLTVLGLVLGLVISFRTSSAYERCVYRRIIYLYLESY